MGNDLIQIARDKLVGLRKLAGGISSFGCVTADGGCPEPMINQGCHAMCPAHVTSKRGIILYSIATGSANNTVPLETQLRYFEWLCSGDSPWQECLHNGHNDDPEFIAKYGLIITDIDKLGKNLVLASLAASRACHEHPKHVIMWDKLVNDGIDPRWAFFLCGCTYTDRQDNVFYQMPGNANHWPLHPRAASELYIKNFLTQNVTFDKVPFAGGKGLGSSVGGVWGPYNNVNTQYGQSCYGQSKYWLEFEKKVGTVLKDLGGFQRTRCADYKDFLKVAKSEQERLYG